MAEPLKNIYNQEFFSKFIPAIEEISKDFDGKYFLEDIYDKEWENRELKERMRHITIALKNHLSDDYKTNISVLLKSIPVLLKSGFKVDSLEFIFYPDFIEVYGLEDYKTSIKTMEKLTQFITCEFAIRPFILKYEEKMVSQMLIWSKHKHAMVRRLSTEGCRPRLPWAVGIPSFKKTPSPILPILENLKNDSSESVRRSVANNLNDISKDNPKIVISIIKSWQSETKETDALLKHAARTLLKQGDIEVMGLFGFGKVDTINIENFKIITPRVKINGVLEFSFDLVSTNSLKSKLRLEYGIYYQKANGTLSRKVFKISEKDYAANSRTNIIKKQSFKIITTRKFHLGLHQVSLIVNGVEFEKRDFELGL